MKQLAPGWRRIAFKLKISKFCLAWNPRRAGPRGGPWTLPRFVVINDFVGCSRSQSQISRSKKWEDAQIWVGTLNLEPPVWATFSRRTERDVINKQYDERGAAEVSVFNK